MEGGKIISVFIDAKFPDGKPVPGILHKNIDPEAAASMGLPLIEGGYIKNNLPSEA